MGRGRAAVRGTRGTVASRTGWRPSPVAGRMKPDPRAAVQVATDVYRTATGLLEDATTKADTAFNTHLNQGLYREVRRLWPQPGNAPTATGYSVQLLGASAQAVGDRLVWTIENSAPYAGFIRQKRHGNQLVSERVVFSLGYRVSEELARDLANSLAAEV